MQMLCYIELLSNKILQYTDYSTFVVTFSKEPNVNICLYALHTKQWTNEIAGCTKETGFAPAANFVRNKANTNCKP